jgi:hypothetical protein
VKKQHPGRQDSGGAPPSVSKTYGTVSADNQKKMSGLQFVQGLADGSRRAVHTATVCTTDDNGRRDQTRNA